MFYSLCSVGSGWCLPGPCVLFAVFSRFGWCLPGPCVLFAVFSRFQLVSAGTPCFILCVRKVPAGIWDPVFSSLCSYGSGLVSAGTPCFLLCVHTDLGWYLPGPRVFFSVFIRIWAGIWDPGFYSLCYTDLGWYLGPWVLFSVFKRFLAGSQDPVCCLLLWW